eukprot:scaffold95797_cov28-Tisochrysis_lutea.AAC.6
MMLYIPPASEAPPLATPRPRLLSAFVSPVSAQDWYDNVYPSGKEFWTTRAWPSLEWQLVEMLLLARDGILHADHQIKRHGYRCVDERTSSRHHPSLAALDKGPFRPLILVF